MEKARISQNHTSESVERERTDEIPTSAIASSSEIMAQHNVSMMANDWIPNEPLPAGPRFSEEEYKRDLERMQKLVPSWALSLKKETMIEKEGKAPSPSASDNPLR